MFEKVKRDAHPGRNLKTLFKTAGRLQGVDVFALRTKATGMKASPETEQLIGALGVEL